PAQPRERGGAVLRRAARAYENAAPGPERDLQRRLQPIKSAPDVRLPCHAEIFPAQLIQSAHVGLRAGVQHEDVRIDLFQNTVSRALVGDVGRDRGDTEPGTDRRQRVRVAGNNRHPGAMRDQRLDQPEAKATASTGDDSFLVFEVHRFASTFWTLSGVVARSVSSVTIHLFWRSATALRRFACNDGRENSLSHGTR